MSSDCVIKAGGTTLVVVMGIFFSHEHSASKPWNFEATISYGSRRLQKFPVHLTLPFPRQISHDRSIVDRGFPYINRPAPEDPRVCRARRYGPRPSPG